MITQSATKVTPATITDSKSAASTVVKITAALATATNYVVDSYVGMEGNTFYLSDKVTLRRLTGGAGESYCAAIVKIRILLARDDSNAAAKFNLFGAALSDTWIGSTDATISSTNSLVDVSVITYSDKTSNTAFWVATAETNTNVVKIIQWDITGSVLFVGGGSIDLADSTVIITPTTGELDGFILKITLAIDSQDNANVMMIDDGSKVILYKSTDNTSWTTLKVITPAGIATAAFLAVSADGKKYSVSGVTTKGSEDFLYIFHDE